MTVYNNDTDKQGGWAPPPPPPHDKQKTEILIKMKYQPNWEQPALKTLLNLCPALVILAGALTGSQILTSNPQIIQSWTPTHRSEFTQSWQLQPMDHNRLHTVTGHFNTKTEQFAINSLYWKPKTLPGWLAVLTASWASPWLDAFTLNKFYMVRDKNVSQWKMLMTACP